MAETLAKQKQGLLVIPWEERIGVNINSQAVRMVKMVAPVCKKCSGSGGAWWETCPHDPYHSDGFVEETVREWETDDQGREVLKAENLMRVRRRIPNVRQVGVHTRIRSKMGLQAQLARGWKFPKDVDPGDGKHTGYAPMCEFNNCYAPNPTVKTTAGAYCSPVQAKRILQKERGKVVEVYDREKARKDLDAEPLT